MASAPFDIIAGPADVWFAAVGTAFTAVDATDATRTSGTWTNLGQTDGGVKVKHTDTVDLLKADQRSGPVKAIRSEEGLEISFNLQEATFANFSVLLNGNTVTASGAPNKNTMKLYQGFDVKQWAFMVRGPSPYMTAYLQYNVPVMVQTDEPELVFARDGKVLLAAKLVALEDPNAATSFDRFGSIVAQTS